MLPLPPAHRHEALRLAAIRTGIHQPLLTALADVHTESRLPDGTTGLGVIPANQIPLEAVSTFNDQANVAATTLRCLSQTLRQQGWQADDFWDAAQGAYTPLFLRQVANGFTPAPADQTAARLELCAVSELQRAYQQRVKESWETVGAVGAQAFLDEALLFLVKQIPAEYFGLSGQQQALLEGVRLWQELDDRAGAIAALTQHFPTLTLDAALQRFVAAVLPTYSGQPHQREALLRLTQLWLQQPSREQTIYALAHGQIRAATADLDTALLTFIQHLPQQFAGTGEQRNALVEGLRQWQGLASRPATLIGLGVDPLLFSGTTPDPQAIHTATRQTDRALMDFIQRLPEQYSGSPSEQTALLHLAQLWYNTPTAEQTLQRLMQTLKQTETARRDSVDALPAPLPVQPSTPLEPPSTGWTPSNLQLDAPISPNSYLTWAMATWGGIYVPTHAAVVDCIVHTADRVQQVCDRVGRPLTIVCWYCPTDHNPVTAAFPQHRHRLGDAITFYCEGLTGKQLYWFLHPWWNGKLAYRAAYPHLCYIDARGDRVRQLQH